MFRIFKFSTSSSACFSVGKQKICATSSNIYIYDVICDVKCADNHNVFLNCIYSNEEEIPFYHKHDLRFNSSKSRVTCVQGNSSG